MSQQKVSEEVGVGSSMDDAVAGDLFSEDVCASSEERAGVAGERLAELVDAVGESAWLEGDDASDDCRRVVLGAVVWS